MPFIPDDTPVLGRIQSIEKPVETDEGPAPTFFGELLPAAFSTQNSIGSLYADRRGILKRFESPEIDYSFDPFKHLEGYEEYADRFAWANSEEDVADLKTQIDNELAARKTIEDGGALGYVANFAAAVLDPINLIPVGGAAAKTYKFGGSWLKGAASIGRGAIIGASLQETVLQATQDTRTFGESALNIGAAGFLGAVLGGALPGLSRHLKSKGKNFGAFLRDIEKDLTIPPLDKPDLLAPNSIEISAADLVADTARPKLIGNIAIDTRGSGVQYHGSANEIALREQGQYTGAPNIYGSGFYTTEALDVAASYTGKNKRNAPEFAPHVYKIHEKEPVNFYNMDAPLEDNPAVRQALIEKLKANNDELSDEMLESVESGLAKSLSHLFNEARAASPYMDLPSHEVVERFDDIIDSVFKKLGYGGFEHVGGRLTGSAEPHKVKIYFDPHKQIDLEKIDIEPFKQKPIPESPMPQKIGEGGSVGAAMVNKTDEKLKFVFGLDRIKADPVLRTATSPSRETRRVVQELAETPLYYDKNALGLPTGAENTAGAVETRVKWISDSLRYGAFRDLKAEFHAYKKSSVPEKMSWDEFKIEVSKAMRRGDEHAIPEVANAAKKIRPVFDKLKDEAIALKLLPEDVKVETAASYLSRVYDHNRIKAEEPQFKAIVFNWLKSVNKDMDSLELDDVAQGIIDNILGAPAARNSYEPMAVRLRSGALKERVFNIPDELIEDYLINDIELITNRYVQSLVPDLEIIKKFGSVNLKDQIDNIKLDYQAKINAIKGDTKEAIKARQSLQKRMRRDVRDIEGMRDRIRGTFGLNANNVWQSASLAEAATTLKIWNYARLLGSVLISALSDIPQIIMKNGMTRVFGDAVIPFTRNMGTLLKRAVGKKGTTAFDAAIDEIRDMGIAVELFLNSRVGSIADIGSVYNTNSLARFNRKLAHNMTCLTGLSAWNDGVKFMAAYVGMSRIIKASLKGSQMSAKELEHLAYVGISPDTARSIAEQFRKFGNKEKGIISSGAKNWTDREAYEAFASALKKITDVTIVTPGQDKPLFLSTTWGSVIGQFKSYGISAYQRILLSGLQQRDLAFLNGSMLMVSMGMLQYAIRTTLAGRELSEDPAKWVIEGVDRSALLGHLMDANNILEKLTGGTVGINALAGAGPMSRYATRSGAAALAGPTFGLAEDAFTGASALFKYGLADETPSESDIRALRRIIPFQNHFMLSKVFDAAEDGLKSVLGVESKK